MDPEEQVFLENSGLDPSVCSGCHDVIHETLLDYEEDDDEDEQSLDDWLDKRV